MSQNFSTGYDITQTGDLFALQDNRTRAGFSQYSSARGTTIQSPLNYRRLKIFKGLHNALRFFVRDQDRKPLPLHGAHVNISIVTRRQKTSIVNKKCEVVDPDRGEVKVTIDTADIHGLDAPSLVDVVLTYTNERGETLPLFTDQNLTPHYQCEISDENNYIPLLTQVEKDFFDQGDGYSISKVFYGPTYWGKNSGLVTFAVYTDNYTGEFYLQGTTSDSPSTSDWFDLELSVQQKFHYFTNETGIEPFSLKSNLKFLRTRHQNGQGSLDKVVIRL
jgi:hypothetical protein